MRVPHVAFIRNRTLAVKAKELFFTIIHYTKNTASHLQSTASHSFRYSFIYVCINSIILLLTQPYALSFIRVASFFYVFTQPFTIFILVRVFSFMFMQPSVYLVFSHHSELKYRKSGHRCSVPGAKRV